MCIDLFAQIIGKKVYLDQTDGQVFAPRTFVNFKPVGNAVQGESLKIRTKIDLELDDGGRKWLVTGNRAKQRRCEGPFISSTQLPPGYRQKFH